MTRAAIGIGALVLGILLSTYASRESAVIAAALLVAGMVGWWTWDWASSRR